MIVHVACPYQAEVVPLGKRRPLTQTFYERVPVDIDLVDPINAPVAFKLKQDDDPPIELRWRDGKVWWSLHGGPRNARITIAEWSETVGKESLWGIGLGLVEALPEPPSPAHGAWRARIKKYDPWPRETIEEAAPRKIISTKRDEAVARLNRKAREVMFCDDKVWVIGEDPQYKISTDTPYGNKRRYKLSCDDLYPPDLTPFVRDEFDNDMKAGRTFRADQIDAAVQTVVSLNKNEQTKPDVMPSIEVLIPEAVRSDPLTPYLRSVGADLAEGVSYPLPRIQEAERAALRRQLHSLYDDKSTKAAEWADPIARLCALEESAWHKKFPTGRGAPGGPLIHRARQALERLATEASAGVEAAIPQTIEDEVIAQFAR